MNSFTKYNSSNAPQGSSETIIEFEKNYGFIPNIIGQMAESPVLVKAYKALGDLLAGGTLDITEQQVVLMTINRFHECRYCMAGHTKVSEMTGVDMDVVNAIRNDKPLNNPKLGALRGFTLALVEQRGKVSQAQLRALIMAGYSKETVLEIVAAAAYKTMSNYTNHIVGTELDSAFVDKSWVPVNDR